MEGGMCTGSHADHVRVEVRHHCPPPDRYTWELHRVGKTLPVKESDVRFNSWEEASKAGKKALEEFLLRKF
jgi:hypothetical protein